MQTLSQKQQLFSLNASKLITYIYAQGYACTFGEAYRTPEQALIDVQKGTGIADSLHCIRLAIDLNLFKGEEYLTDKDSYQQFGTYWKSLDPRHRWGGDFPHLVDSNHFEMQNI
jgi:hypothetical protein